MASSDSWRDLVLPAAQKRTLAELGDELEIGPRRPGSRSAFWTMLLLSAVIASAGLMRDSTATVIGAMIIAPLSTPIMGIALAIAKQTGTGALRYVLGGTVLVIGLGAAFSLLLPGTDDLLGIGQVAARTSPTLLDLVAALATGLAGAIALARRDVAAVLPGVAIAISLVPPLAVVGLCLGAGLLEAAAGAFLLYASNLVALVLAGTIVFTALGYGRDDADVAPRLHGRPRLRLAVVSGLVVVPLALNTLVTYEVKRWTDRLDAAAHRWIGTTPGAEVTRVELVSTTADVYVQAPGVLPPVAGLVDSLRGELPAGFHVVVHASQGQRIDAGTIPGG